MSTLSNFFFGTPSRMRRETPLSQQQLQLHDQQVGAAMGPGAGGAFGEAGDYFRSLMSPDSQTMQQFAAPEMRRFREQTIPGLAQQFAGMGVGMNRGGAFGRAMGRAGADLGERLGQIRAGLGMQGAQGLMGLGQQAMQPQYQLAMQQRAPGFLESIAPGIGRGIGMLSRGLF